MIAFNKSQSGKMGGVRVAEDPWTRFIGLLATDPKRDSRGLWLTPCRSIHTLGMRYPLDILFLDRGLGVLKMDLQVKPFCPAVLCRNAHSVLEFFSGYWDSSLAKVGDQLEMITE